MFKAIISILTTIILASCATVQEQKVKPEEALLEIQKLTKAGNVDDIVNYFNQHGTFYPDGITGTKSSQPALYLGSEQKLYTAELVARKYKEHNEAINQLKIQCDRNDEPLRKLRCLSSGNSPCSSSRDIGCTVKEDQNAGVKKGTYALSGVSSIIEFVPFVNAENLEWYSKSIENTVSEVNSNQSAQDVQSEFDIKKSLATQQEIEGKWISFCKRKGVKAVFKANVEPINKFDGNGVFSFVSVGFQHCIGNTFNSRFQYLNYCPGNRNRTCGVVYGLPKDVRAGQLLPRVYLAYTKALKGTDSSGLGSDKLAGLTVISTEEIKNQGLE